MRRSATKRDHSPHRCGSFTRAFALAAVALALGACAAAPCEERAFWRNSSSTACAQCQSEMCMTERMTLMSSATVGPCAPEYACASRCADASNSTCGCTEQCLPTERCRSAWDGLAACAVRACAERCR